MEHVLEAGVGFRPRGRWEKLEDWAGHLGSDGRVCGGGRMGGGAGVDKGQGRRKGSGGLGMD